MIPAITKEGQADRAEERREDDSKQAREWPTIALLASTVVLLGWQVSERVRVYDLIRDQADAAQRSLVGTQRPWIEIKSVIFNGPITFDESGAHGIIDLLTENVGHSPALHIWFEQRALAMAAGVRDDSIAIAQEDLCNARRSKMVGADGPGFALFPGGTITKSLPLSIARADVETAIHKPLTSNVKGAVPFYFFGCVDYAFSFVDGHHQTPF